MGLASRERAEELVRIVVDLYGAGLERVVEIVQELEDPARKRLVDRLVGDDLVASLLILHDLHPHSTAERVEQALVRVRRMLRASDADIELVRVDDEGVVHLRLMGQLDGCTEEGVQAAVTEAAPEATGVAIEKGPARVTVAFTTRRRSPPTEATG